MSPIRRAKGRPLRERKISKIALVVQPKVNSISPAADRSNGQETTAENKAPRCSQRPARPPGSERCGHAFWKGRWGEVSAAPPAPSPFLPGERVRRGKGRREGARGAGRERGGPLMAGVRNASLRSRGGQDPQRAEECAECGAGGRGERSAAGPQRLARSGPGPARQVRPAPGSFQVLG